MGNDIKNLLDDITKDVDASHANQTSDVENVAVTTDIGSFREKLSLYVLKDIICAMLDENIDDVDEMVDNAIMKHIRDNYDGSCYGYLCHARDRLASPEMNIFGNIIQEINEKCNAVSEMSCRTKNPIQEASTSDVKELLNGVENYEEFADKLKKEVSQQVVDDVVKVISKSSEAPVFEDINKKIKVVDKPDPSVEPGSVDEENDITTESAILNRVGRIVSEGAIAGEAISIQEAYDRAYVDYAIHNLDLLTKACPKIKIR